MTRAEKALQYFIIAVPEDKEQAESYFWARCALNAAIRAERAVGESVSLLTNADLLARAEAAEARAEKAEKERDAAVNQMRGDCEKCAHYTVIWNGCTPDYECPLSDRCLNRDLWEWDGGVKEE